MSTENTSSAAASSGARSDKRKPDAKEGDVAVWLESRRDDPTKKVASIAVGPQGAKKYFKANAQVNGVNLTAAQILDIYLDRDVAIEFPGAKGPYVASLAKADVVKVPWKADPTKHDVYVNIGMAIHLVKDLKNEAGEKTGEKEHWGYKISAKKGESVTFPRVIKHGEDHITLSARDVLKLNNRETVKAGDVSVTLDRIEQEGQYQRARIATNSGDKPAHVVAEEDTVAVGEANTAGARV